MALLTKNQLSASNASSFPDNTTGAITPQILRDFNTNMIDTLVDSLVTSSYALTDATNDFTTEQLFTSISASSFVSASEFVGDGSKITGITASVALPILDEGILQGYATSMNFTGSAINAQVIAGTAVVRVNVEGAGFVSTSSFNAYTSSNDSKVNSLISATGSYAISSSVAAVDAAQQAQINSLIAQTGSNDNTSLNAFTASQESKDQTLATYTASVDTKFSNIGGQSGSWDNTSLNAFSASQLTKDATIANVTASLQQQLTNIGSQSGSWITESETGSFARTDVSNTFTGVQQFNDGIRFDDSNRFIEASGADLNMASYAGKLNLLSNSEIIINPVTGVTIITGSVLNVTAPNAIFNTISSSQVSASFFVGDGSGLTNLPGQVPLTSLNAYTQSNDQKWSNLAGQSGSWVTESETGSFARTNVDNNFTANQTFTNITAVSASFQYVQTTYETSSVIYSSGSNQFGDAADDIQTLNGTVIVSGSQQLTGSLGVTGNITLINGNAVSASHFHALATNGILFEANGGTDVALFGAGGGNGATFYGQVNANAVSASTINGIGSPELFSQSVDNRLDQLEAATSSIVPLTSLNAFTASQEIKNTTLENVTSSLNAFTASQASLNATFATTGSNTFDGNQIISGGVTLSGSLGITYVDGGAEVIQQVTALGNYQTLYDGGLLFQTDGINNYEQTIHTTLSKGLTVDSGSVLNDGVTVNGGFTASLQQGYVWVGDVTGKNIEVPTSSFASGGQTFANPSVESISGSLVLSALTFTSGAANLLHLSASAQNQSNLVFKNNNNTADTIVSGSNNIFINPASTTAGFKRYIGGSNNIFNTTSLPQITGSMQFSPNMTGNIGIGVYTLRGPVSSSAWNINSNYNAGTIAIGQLGGSNTAEKLTGGLNISANTIQGTVTIVANQSFLTGSNTALINNSINGGVTMNLSSSAASLSNNIINDSAFILTNQFYSSSVGLGAVNMNRNNIGGQANFITITGTLPGGTTSGTSISDNFILGGNNTLFVDASNARVSGSTLYYNAVRNGLLGNALVVSGSSLLSDASSHGSVFVGRYNAVDGIRDKTSDVVFAVGTGNTSARKTGFLIDSGSNTFVEGTLNVSGSSSFTGSVNGNVVSMSVNSNTASMDFSLGNYFELSASVSPIRIELTNVTGGTTKTLAMNGVTSSTIVWSSNVLQPSGSAYTSSVSGSNDILSFVAFNSSLVNVVSTLKMI